jgi:signal-transduction protein with cAMP-binding, CBS, and nucleotidyltransferase domain
MQVTANSRYISPEASLIEAASKMRALGVSALPVYRMKSDGSTHGVITERDITCRAVAAGMDPAKTTVSDVMTQEVADPFCRS